MSEDGDREIAERAVLGLGCSPDLQIRKRRLIALLEVTRGGGRRYSPGGR
jgi:hypothetical protein